MQHYAPETGTPREPSEPVRQTDQDEDDAETERNGRPPRPSLEDLVDALAEHRGNVAAVSRVFERGETTVRRWVNEDGLDLSLFR